MSRHRFEWQMHTCTKYLLPLPCKGLDLHVACMTTYSWRCKIVSPLVSTFLLNALTLKSSAFLTIIIIIIQCAKKVVSDSPGLVDFAIGLVNSVFNLPDGLACSAGVFFERAICSQKCHVETSRREEMGWVKGSGEEAGREKRKFFLPSPSPLSFFRSRTYRKGYYFYSPQSSTVLKSKMAATTILRTRTIRPPKIRLQCRLPTGKWSFLRNSNKKNCEINSALQKGFGASWNDVWSSKD